jgi:gas vesicle protein
MFEIVIGAIIGAFVSLIIAELYHRRAGKETAKELEKLANLNVEITNTLNDAISIISESAENTELIKQHAVVGTSDDPEYPYKS